MGGNYSAVVNRAIERDRRQDARLIHEQEGDA